MDYIDLWKWGKEQETRGLQNQILRQKLEEEQGELNAYSGLRGYLNKPEVRSLYTPTVTEEPAYSPLSLYDQTGAGALSTEQKTTMPSQSIYDVSRDYFLKEAPVNAATTKLGLQFGKEAEAERRVEKKELDANVDKILQWAVTNPNGLKNAWVFISTLPGYKKITEGVNAGEIKAIDEQTVTEPVRADKSKDDKGNYTGEIIGYNVITIGSDGKKNIHFVKKDKDGIPKEANMPPAYDLVGTKYLGNKYQTPEGRAEFANMYASNPQIQKEVTEKIREESGARYSGLPPIYNVVPGYQTTEGQPAILNVRKGQIQGGQPLQKTPSEGDVSEVRKKVAIDTVIEEIDKAFDSAETSLPQSPTGRIIGYPTRAGKVMTQADSKLVLADSLSAGFLAKFARAAGEVGTMTEGDIDRARKLIPTIHDTKEVRKGKLRQAKELYNEIYQRGKRQQNPLGPQGQQGARTIIETRTGKDGKRLIKYSDGTIEKEQ